MLEQQIPFRNNFVVGGKAHKKELNVNTNKYSEVNGATLKKKESAF